MANGETPQTDRELIIVINEKVSTLIENDKRIFSKLSKHDDSIAELNKRQTQAKGRCALEDQRVEQIEKAIEKQPSLVKAVIWTGIIVGMFTSAVNTAFAIWR